jgi:hypothetical protein
MTQSPASRALKRGAPDTSADHDLRTISLALGGRKHGTLQIRLIATANSGDRWPLLLA